MIKKLMMIAKKLEKTELFDYLEGFKKDLTVYAKHVESLCQKYDFDIDGMTPTKMVEEVYYGLLGHGDLKESPAGVVYVRPIKANDSYKQNFSSQFKLEFRNIIKRELIPNLKKLKSKVPFNFNPKIFSPLLRIKIKGYGEINSKIAEQSKSVIKKLDQNLKNYKKYQINQFDKLAYAWIKGNKVIYTTSYPPKSINVIVGKFKGDVNDFEDQSLDREMYLRKNVSDKKVFKEFNKVDTYNKVDKYEIIKNAGKIDKPQNCKYCQQPATKALGWAEGRAYIPVCDKHIDKATKQIEVTNKDNVDFKKDIPQKKAILAPMDLDKAPNCKFCSKEDIYEIKNWMRNLQDIQNGANVHNVKNLLAILQGYLDLTDLGGDVNKKELKTIFDRSKKMYKKYSGKKAQTEAEQLRSLADQVQQNLQKENKEAEEKQSNQIPTRKQIGPYIGVKKKKPTKNIKKDKILEIQELQKRIDKAVKDKTIKDPAKYVLFKIEKDEFKYLDKKERENIIKKHIKKQSNQTPTRKQPIEKLEGENPTIDKLNQIADRIKQVRDIRPEPIKEPMTPVKEITSENFAEKLLKSAQEAVDHIKGKISLKETHAEIVDTVKIAKKRIIVKPPKQIKITIAAKKSKRYDALYEIGDRVLHIPKNLPCEIMKIYRTRCECMDRWDKTHILKLKDLKHI